jgi:nitrite reductase (NADH) large subunit
MRYVLVGGGAASASAALAIRKLDAEGEVLVVTEEPYPFYSRIRLLGFLAGDIAEEELFLFKSQWYEEHRIRLLKGARAERLLPQRRQLVLAGSDTIVYDRLLLATGSVPFVPPVEGVGLEGVFTLRGLDDVKALATYARDKESVLVLGGGALGLEAGYALRKKGLRVKVAEVAPRLLPRQLDEDCARMLQGHLQKLGLEFHLGVRARRLLGEKRVEAVELDDGRVLQAQVVLVSAGVRPRVELARSSGLRLQRGIVVDDSLRTSCADIWAAGDCAEHRGVCYGFWAAAQGQGRVAGTNMAGGKALYEGTIAAYTVRIAGLEVFSAGDIEPEGPYECILSKDEQGCAYRKVALKEGRITGCILMGRTLQDKQALLRAIQGGRRLSALEASSG